MSFGDIVKSVIEIAVVLFTIWAVFHEDRFIAFEDKIRAAYRRRSIKVIKGNSYGDCKSFKKIS